MLDQEFEYQKSQAEIRSPGSGNSLPRPKQTGLCVAVYQADNPSRTYRDHLYYAGFAMILLQLGIAAIPLGIFGDWSIFLITVSGITLSFTTCSIPQWKREKWGCRGHTKKNIVLTGGNGSQFAILILGDGKGLDLEDLSAGRGSQMNPLCQLQITILAVLWIVLLITATAVKQHTWFLFGVCAIGIFQNIYVAVTWRTPEAYGVPLKFREVIGKATVMKTLYAVEEAYPQVGRSMRDTFFPGRLRPDELSKWDFYEALASRARTETRAIK